ncbi:hypothetical protein Rhe02_79440 [Rhizocola hellebori]|uniref:Uncharacterized protein n=1 Tax=Rhizocola hellebori TaxID=1392758 RepID=A0A8J3QHS9_9ACTN|nr:hypothetical protein Rhe02_79440 [Rhizocola hellebori]
MHHLLANGALRAYGEEVTEVPEGDAHEQNIPVEPDYEEFEPPAVGLEVPEADAIEQSIPVPADEDDYV